jgi:anti-sigma regulatory factor (Ser/Thr protein kinase)
MLVSEHRFTNDPRAPRGARVWMAESLLRLFPPVQPALDALVQDVLIVVSELVTNAVRCGASEGVVAYYLENSYLQVTVTDNGVGWPRLRDAGPTDEQGRGLLVVCRLATTVGADPVDGGKQVWARLAVDPALTGRSAIRARLPPQNIRQPGQGSGHRTPARCHR